MPTSTPRTQGAHHIGLTVPDLDAARSFFVEALGFSQVGDIPEYPAVFLSDQTLMLTLWRAEDPSRATPFDRRTNIGLHHFALRVSDRGELEQLAGDMARRVDVDVEFPPQPLGGAGAWHMMLRIPGNIRLELLAAPA